MRLKSKKQNQKKRDKHKARSLSLNALGYQISLKRLLAGISVMLNSLHFGS